MIRMTAREREREREMQSMCRTGLHEEQDEQNRCFITDFETE